MSNMGALSPPISPCISLYLPVSPHISLQEKRIYAPMSNMGDLTYDADAVYINIPDAAVSSRC